MSVLVMQLVGSETLSEDALSLVATDGGDSGAARLGYNLISLVKSGYPCKAPAAVMLNRSHEAHKGTRLSHATAADVLIHGCT